MMDSARPRRRRPSRRSHRMNSMFDKSRSAYISIVGEDGRGEADAGDASAEGLGSC
jgi:hypothetical protein